MSNATGETVPPATDAVSKIVIVIRFAQWSILSPDVCALLHVARRGFNAPLWQAALQPTRGRLRSGSSPCYRQHMENGELSDFAPARARQAVWLLWIAGAVVYGNLSGCASPSKDGAASSSWTCFKKASETEPCQCQTTPVGGKQEIIDRCGPELVRADGGAAEAECCKDWLWLNGKQVSAYYCACYAKGAHTCNDSIGDELVDSCP
jgi:hypothetical protein